MTKSVVAERYARAMFDLAQQQNQTKQLQEELSEVLKAFQASPELKALLESPTFTPEKKKAIVREVLVGASATVIHSIGVLLDNNRMNEFTNVIDAFNELAYASVGVAPATVYSTRELTDEEKQSISTAFAKKVGKTSLLITNIIEPNLIGGIRLQIGNHIYDSSVKAKLARLERQMIG